MKTALLTGGLLTLSSMQTAQAIGITLDGDLSDLIAAVTSSPDHSGSVSESGSDGEGNGFDITNAYFHYDIGSDTFYGGFHTSGQFGTSGGTEGGFFGCPPSYITTGTAGVFDGCESIGFQVDIGNDGVDFEYRVKGDNVANSGTGTESPFYLVNPHAASFLLIASEANNGVEFSVTGLGPLAFSYTNPLPVTMNFFAGSTTNYLPEDTATINAQVVPLPAAVWLFGSGLLGLAGLARRKKV